MTTSTSCRQSGVLRVATFYLPPLEQFSHSCTVPTGFICCDGAKVVRVDISSRTHLTAHSECCRQKCCRQRCSTSQPDGWCEDQCSIRNSSAWSVQISSYLFCCDFGVPCDCTSTMTEQSNSEDVSLCLSERACPDRLGWLRGLGRHESLSGTPLSQGLVWPLISLHRVFAVQFHMESTITRKAPLSTRSSVLPFIFDCYSNWTIHMARCLVQRHLLYSAKMVCLMGHTAVQKYVAEALSGL